MGKENRATLKTFFETGDKPTQAQFADLIDSLFALLDTNIVDKTITVNIQTFGTGAGGKILKGGNAVIQFNEFGLDDITISSDDGSFAAGGTMFNASNESSLYFDGQLGFTITAVAAVINFPGVGAIVIGDASPFPVTALMIVKANTTSLKNLQTFANNAAALAGGLIIDDTYKTATGELRIVV